MEVSFIAFPNTSSPNRLQAHLLQPCRVSEIEWEGERSLYLTTATGFTDKVRLRFASSGVLVSELHDADLAIERKENFFRQATNLAFLSVAPEARLAEPMFLSESDSFRISRFAVELKSAVKFIWDLPDARAFFSFMLHLDRLSQLRRGAHSMAKQMSAVESETSTQARELMLRLPIRPGMILPCSIGNFVGVMNIESISQSHFAGELCFIHQNRDQLRDVICTGAKLTREATFTASNDANRFTAVLGTIRKVSPVE